MHAWPCQLAMIPARTQSTHEIHAINVMRFWTWIRSACVQSIDVLPLKHRIAINIDSMHLCVCSRNFDFRFPRKYIQSNWNQCNRWIWMNENQLGKAWRTSGGRKEFIRCALRKSVAKVRRKSIQRLRVDIVSRVVSPRSRQVGPAYE